MKLTMLLNVLKQFINGGGSIDGEATLTGYNDSKETTHKDIVSLIDKGIQNVKEGVI